METLIRTWVPFSRGAIKAVQALPAAPLIKRFEYINSNTHWLQGIYSQTKNETIN